MSIWLNEVINAFRNNEEGIAAVSDIEKAFDKILQPNILHIFSDCGTKGSTIHRFLSKPR